MRKRKTLKLRRLCIGAVLSLASLGLVTVGNTAMAADPSPTLTLRGTVRDFKAEHPDFENAISDDRNIVKELLGADEKPVYNPSDYNPTVFSEESFNQWYRDVEDVNLSKTYDITLELIPGSDPPTYQYVNPAFFPIDNELWGNEGQPHNYWFTYEIHSSFTYQGGEVFNFSGDDDVWVFVNDHLVIDLGGVHPPESAAVNMDAVAAQAGITPGNTYDFDIFYAERHTHQSTFVISQSSVVFDDPPDEDSDDDGTADGSDNCPEVANPDQEDGDGDGIGDACDPDPNDGPLGDADGDGVTNEDDPAPNDACVPNDDGADCDSDGDGVANGVDNCPDASNQGQADGDGDGIGDACDPDAVAPTSKEQCKKDGWRNFYVPRRFKSQGDCVASVTKK